MDSRNAAFLKLKPVCVSLSQSILLWNDGKGLGGPAAIIKGLQTLNQTLKEPRITATLDDKLADYVFFPISAALQRLENLPLRARELTLGSVLLLLETAWRSSLSADLGLQLIILITFILDNGGTNPGQREDNETLDSICLRCLARIFTALHASAQGNRAFTSPAHAPQIGKTLSVVLGLVTSSDIADVQLAALVATSAFCESWPEQESMCLKFFPGIVSTLNRLLSPKPSQKVSAKVLVKGNVVLASVITRVLADERTETLPDSPTTAEPVPILNKKWLLATSAQVKLALSNIMKLRNHGNSQVRISLAQHCLKLLHHCWKSLAESLEMLLETLIIVAIDDANIAQSLRNLMITQHSIPATLRTTLYNTVQALPRIMLSSDDSLRKRVLAQISITLFLLQESGIELSMIDDILATNIRDSVLNTITKSSKEAVAIQSSSDLQLDSISNRNFLAILPATRSQKQILSEVGNLLIQITEHDPSLQIAMALLSDIRNAKNDIRLASIWICLNSARAAVESSLSEMITFDDTNNSIAQILDELYSVSVDILCETDHQNQDWRLRALALECVVLQAQYHKTNFRTELIECLYPVVYCMGSEVTAVRAHAIVAVDLLAKFCGYESSAHMIIANVDYMVNAISLRLNSFDLSPQAPRVLSMMIKLAGPSLLPYLDDTVDSIFAILDSFHGYPKLVEQLFEVLKSITEQGVVEPQLLVDNKPASSQFESKNGDTKLATISQLSGELTQRQSRIRRLKLEDEIANLTSPNSHELRQNHIAEKAESSAPKSKIHQLNTEQDLHENSSRTPTKETSSEPANSSQSKTYTLLLKIARLTQHYLTSSSLELRLKLLSLLTTVVPILAQDEDAFLPFVNLIWPVVLPRLQDTESFVVVGALQVIAILCQHAKGFMSSRIEEAWPVLSLMGEQAAVSSPRAQPKLTMDLHLDHQKQGQTQSSLLAIGAWELQSSTTSPAIRTVLVQLLIAVLDNVSMSDEMVENISNMLMPFAVSDAAIQQVLTRFQPDAFWLYRWRYETRADHTLLASSVLVQDLRTPTAANWQFVKALT